MVGDIGMHRADHADLVDHLRGVAKKLADLDAALTVLPEAERRLHGRAGLALGGELGGHGLAVVPGQHRLRIEGVNVRRPAVCKQVDDALGPAQRRRLGREGIDAGDRQRRRSRGRVAEGGAIRWPHEPGISHQAAQRESPHAHA